MSRREHRRKQKVCSNSCYTPWGDETRAASLERLGEMLTGRRSRGSSSEEMGDDELAAQEFLESFGGLLSGVVPDELPDEMDELDPKDACLMETFEKHMKDKVTSCVRERIPSFLFPAFAPGKPWDPFGEGGE